MKKAIIVAATILIVFILIYFNNYSFVRTFDISGYVFNDDNVTDNLMNGNVKSNKKLSYSSVHTNDALYSSRGNYYIGEKNKKQINNNYPVVSKDGSEIVVIDDVGNLVDSKWKKVSTVKNTIVSNKYLYNETDYERADNSVYLFMELDNGIYINLDNMNINVNGKYTKLPNNSFIYFSVNYLRYYSLSGDQYIYKELGGLDHSSIVTINNKKFAYDDLLKKLGLKDEEEEKPNNIVLINDEKKEEKPATKVPAEKKDAPTSFKEGDTVVYIKPTAKLKNLKGNIYSAKMDLEINDPTSRISKMPTLEFYIGSSLYVRKTFGTEGTIEVSGLKPDTDYEIKAYFEYKNEKGQVVRSNIGEFKVSTLDISNVEKLKLSIGDIKSYPSYADFNDIKLDNKETDEVLKGLKSLQITIGKNDYQISNALVKKLAKLDSINYSTAKTLKSNTEYTLNFVATDLAGNNLEIEYEDMKFKTLKEKPSFSVKVLSTDIDKAKVSFEITNRDDIAITNLRYVLTDVDKQIIYEGKVPDDKTMTFDNLDASQVYKVYLYGDYDLEDGNGIQKDLSLSEGKFTTDPISSLGYARLKFVKNEITNNSASYNITLDTESTNNKLIELISSIKINVKDGTDNSLYKSFSIESTEMEHFKAGNIYNLDINNLSSNHNYYFEIVTYVKLGSKTHELTTLFNVKDFTTLKVDAIVQIVNKFTTENLIDFDVRIEDPDGAISSDKVYLEARDRTGNLVYVDELRINYEYQRITVDKLDANETYTFKYTVEEYNIGFDNSTFEDNKTLYSEDIVTSVGLYGTVEIDSLLNQITSKNIFDINNNKRWKSAGSYDKARREIVDESTFSLGAKNGYRTYFYYLPEYVGKTVTVSFEAKYKDSNQKPFYISNSGSNNVASNAVNGVNSKEYKPYSYKFTMGSPYIAITIRETTGENNITTVLLKNFQVEVGSKATSYEKYKDKDNYMATIITNVTDSKNEITPDDYNYYLRYYKNDNLVDTEAFKMNDSGSVVDAINKHEIEKSANYEIRLSVRIRGRFYDLNKVEFTSEDEIRTIHNVKEFFAIHTSGNYLVSDDLDFTDSTSNVSEFNGTIDFQGHKLIRPLFRTSNNNSTSTYLIYNLKSKGILKNLDIHYYYNKDLVHGDFYGICYNNYGTITNLKITLEQSYKKGNVVNSFISHVNYGTVENFAIHLKVPLYGARGVNAGSYHNYGTLRNGYLYGEPIDGRGLDNTALDVRRLGGFGSYASENSYVSNVFTTVPVLIDEVQSNIGYQNEVGTMFPSISRTVIRNAYSYTSGDSSIKNFRQLSHDANIYSGTVNAKNLYYADDEFYSGSYSNRISKLSLRDENFQEKILNSSGAFNVKDFVKYGYYPQLNWPSVMPKQDYIELPQVTDTDLIDVLTVDEVEEGEEEANVTVTLNNPAGEKITDIQIANISTSIISQSWSNGKTKLVFRAYNPKTFVSKYSVRKIVYMTAANSTYSRTFSDKERIIDFDVYRKITNISEFNKISSKPSENYKLYADLDFINKTITSINNFTGKFDGNNHTISNIRIESGNPIFYQLTGGTIKNLYVENYRDLSYSSYVGFIGLVQSSGDVENVHLKGVTLYGSYSVGGIAAYTNGSTISDCSVTDIKVYIKDEKHKSYEGRIGGFIGENNTTIIENSFVRGLDMNVTQAFATYGVGGFIGRNNSGYVYNSYAQGMLNTIAVEVGGIVGYNSGYISRVFSAVDVYTQQDSLGGVVGYSTNDYISNTLVVGDVFSSKTNYNQGRTIGNRTAVNSNYAWSGQLINGLISTQANGDILITSEELTHELNYQSLIQLGDEFKYSKLIDKNGHNVLPKLTYKNSDKLLPNQEDIEFYSSDFKIKEITINKTINNAIINLSINNPDNFKIKNINFNDMEIISVNKNVNLDGETIYEVTAKPIHYYDSYLINEVEYVSNGQTKKASFGAKIELSFYKDISKYEDWQNISTDLFENYRLIADIDFSGKTNVKTNVNINRLEGTDGGHTLSNITVNFNRAGQGLIDTVAARISDVNFSNINITNTGSGNYSAVINYLNGNMENVRFESVTVNAPNISYAGMIALNLAQDIRTIHMYDINVSGNAFVGGFIGRTRYFDIKDADVSNVHIKAKSSYVGGFIGYSDWINDPTVFNINGDNIHVSANNSEYVGGLFGLATGSNCSITDSDVLGYRYVGGMYGQSYSRNVNNPRVRNTTVSARSIGIGGIAGYSENITNGYFANGHVIGTTTGSSNVGGIAGYGGWTISSSTVVDSVIESKGDNVGGIKGKLSYSTVSVVGVYNTTVTGRNKVGGIIGTHESTSNTIQYAVTNSVVTATGSFAGGIIGYVANLNTTDQTYKIYIHHDLVEGGTVTASNYAGGLIGYAEKMLFKGHFYNNYVDCDVSSPSLRGYIIGGHDDYADRISSLALYAGNKSNNTVVTSSAVPSNVKLYSIDNLKSKSSYTSIGIDGNFTWDKLSSSKYPSVNSTYPDGRRYNDMPSATGRTIPAESLNSLQVAAFTPLPEVKVYASDADKVNVEFSKIDNTVSFIINNETKELDELTYTYYYNFIDDFNITVTNGISSKKISLKAEDLRNSISVNKNNYYYLDGEKVITNDSNVSKLKVTAKHNSVSKLSNGMAYPINIYNNKILYSDSSVYDIKTKKRMVSSIDNLVSSEVVPMYSFNYATENINTFYNYSSINGHALDKQLFVKDNNLEVVDSSLNNIKNNIFVGNYNDNDYLIYLGEDGSLHSLKDNIKFPSRFKNRNIKSFTSDMYNSSDIIFVLYEDGNYVVFNYKTGKVIEENKSVIEDVFSYFVSSFSKVKTSNSKINEYSDSKELEEKLEDKSIKEVLTSSEDTSKVSNITSTYSTIYNPVTTKYEVYEIPVNDSSVPSDVIDKLSSPSTNYVIKNNSKLNNYYFGTAKTKKNILLSVGIIMSSLIGGIILLLVIIKRQSKKQKYV